MLNRRKMLIGTGAAAVAACAPDGGVYSRAAGLPGLVPENEEAEDLLYALARLEARYYTEEGVSMLLACEDLAAKDGAVPYVPRRLNEQFTEAFRHYTELLDELRGDLGAQDAVGVLELLALRDFESGGGAGR